MTYVRSALDRTLVVLMSVGVLIIAASLGGLFLTAWFPAGPLTRLAIRVVDTPRVNGDLHVEVDYCKSRDTAPAEVRWSLLDGVEIMLPPYVVTLPEGCHVRIVALPLTRVVTPGVYQLQVTGIYHIWPWREDVVTRRSPPFRLLPEHDTP
jgi:hypothetical protein